MTPRPPTPTLFPYTTLFRSWCGRVDARNVRHPRKGCHKRDHILVIIDVPPVFTKNAAVENDQARACEHRFAQRRWAAGEQGKDRKSTRLNSSHSQISYAVFC